MKQESFKNVIPEELVLAEGKQLLPLTFLQQEGGGVNWGLQVKLGLYQ